MSYYLRVCLILLLCVRQDVELSIAFRRFVYQKEMSEYCRRRVMPPVFLGRQVADANSQILHFSRLDLPYSCFISIRSESGSNIIMVIQLMSAKSLDQSCKDNGDQLAVYEMGETFGGYWGPIPDHLMQAEPTKEVKYYTLKTTQNPSTEFVDLEDETDSKDEANIVPLSHTPKTEWPVAGQDPGSYIRMELPIVNVSGKLMPGVMELESMFNVEEPVELVEDVTPSVQMEYHTSMMPLVQFSIDNVRNKVGDKRRGEGVEWSLRYAVDYTDGFTPDSRLIFSPFNIPPFGSTTSKRKIHRYNNKNNFNRLLKLKKSKQFFTAKDMPLPKMRQSVNRRAQYSIQPYNIFTRHYDFIQPPKQKQKTESVPNSWEIIDDILKNLSKTKDVKIDKPSNKKSDLLHVISNMDHNMSVYLAPNLSAYQDFSTTTPQPVTRFSIGPITWRLPSVSYGANILDQLEDTQKSDSIVKLTGEPTSTLRPSTNSEASAGIQTLSSDLDNIVLNDIETSSLANVNSIDVNDSKSTNLLKEASKITSPKSLKLLTGSLVDHESWENVVQSAPVMAVILNKTAPGDNRSQGHDDRTQITTTEGPNNIRKKRFVHAIPIENDRPHKLPVVKVIHATTTPGYKISDAQEFAELVELQDDELHGRVAMRYLRQYVGPVLFNICDYDEATARHVYLFNTSRLVLAINNFTMQRMTVVATPARTLLNSEAHCTGAHLECQVSGARVCIDSLSACDGIPNCGSYDIYDEDRLMCGASAGLQHNVCLAAITFLAVLLTILYTIHYWLKRCVPKVSDAFFIYTDAAENVLVDNLYLDSIMRPPYGGDENKSEQYDRSHIFQEEIQDQYVEGKSFYKRFFKICWNMLRCKRNKFLSREDNMMAEFYRTLPDSQRLYSFAEVEINKIVRRCGQDAAVQTGSSLTMKVNKRISHHILPELRHLNESPGKLMDTVSSGGYGTSTEFQTHHSSYDELTVLKFLRQVRSMSVRSNDAPKVYGVSSPPKQASQIIEEAEIRCFDLDRSERSIPMEQISAASEVHTGKSDLVHVRKRLRFEEETSTIPPAAITDAAEGNEDEKENPHRRSIVLGVSRPFHPQDLDAIEEYEEQGGSREYKSYFWGGKSKIKKAKKKSSLR